MDYMLTEECESREDNIFDPKINNKYQSEFMLDNWAPDSMDLLDSIFDTDFLNLDGIDDPLMQNKNDSYENDLNLNHNNVLYNESIVNSSSSSSSSTLSSLLNVPLYVAETPISSNSSDSGLSSDNLDMDISPEYEPLSPAVSSPGPSISERGEKNSPLRNDSSSSSYLEHLFNENRIIDKKPILLPPSPPSSSSQQQQQKQQEQTKVVVQKIPQIINLPTKRVPNRENNKKEREIKVVKLSPSSQQSLNSSASLTNSNNNKVTIQLKNTTSNGNGGKIQTKPGTFLINNKGKLTEVKKLIPVQTTTSNPRSILLPVTVQDMKGLKTYKVLNMSALKSYSNSNKLQTTQITNAAPTVTKAPTQNDSKVIKIKPKVVEQFPEPTSDVESLILEDIKDEPEEYIEECHDIDDDIEDQQQEEQQQTNDSDSPYPRLILSAEEKRLLAKEGITLPSHYPLTKYEERELKRIRRKIRNKISAQDSRKRKKEYVDGLEERVKQCTEENQTLLKKIKLLQTQNQNLMSQMKKLQTLLSKGTNKTAHPTTCLIVLLLSLALVATPNMKFGQNAKENELNELAAMQEEIIGNNNDGSDSSDSKVIQNRRNLLFDIKDDVFDEELNLNDFIGMNGGNDGGIINNVHNMLNEFLMMNCKMNNDSSMEPPVCKKAFKNFIDFDVDDMNWYQLQEMQKIQQQKQQKNLQKTIFDLAAEAYQKNKSQQTSGFNIDKMNNHDSSENGIFDNNVLQLMKNQPNTPDLYEINLEKLKNFESSTTTTGTNAGLETQLNVAK